MAARGSSGTQKGAKTCDTNDQGVPVVRIHPSESVFSFFLFIVPIEELRAPGKVTTPKVLAWLIMLIALVLQGVIIYAVNQVIVIGDREWQLSVVAPAPTGGACNEGGSLCQTLANGVVTCAPPSVQLSGRWSDLDTDGDGNWTREEAEAAKEQLICKYRVNPVEVFDVFSTFLVNRENIIWIHPAVRAGQGIPRAYFDYAAGDIIMCGYRNANMCPNLLRRGFFDVPLKHGTVPRVGDTIDSALKYCHEMLEDGGICDRTLPSTYTVWKKSSQDQCYGAGYNGFVYEHPVSGRTKSMLAVDYDATKDYQKAERSGLFMIYKACVIMVLICSVFSDAKELVPLLNLVTAYPSAKQLADRNEEFIKATVSPEDDDDVTYEIKGITAAHRASLAFVVLARSIMFVVLLVVGVNFLLKETDYLNLILNGLGLLFIVTLPAELYQQLLNPYLRSKVEQVLPIEVPMLGVEGLNRNPSVKDIMWIAVMLLILFASMSLYLSVVVRPVTEALQCACLSEGPKCREALRFSEEFWDDYWKNTVPSTIKEINSMEADSSGQTNLFQGKDGPSLKVKGKHSKRHTHLKATENIHTSAFF